jgi:flagellar biosynthetic protein FliP
MVAAALAGLLALTPVERLVWPELTARADVGVLVLATNTAIGLAVWMRARGCSWRDVAATAALVHLPSLALLVALWAGEVGGSALLGWGHVVTVPAVALALVLRPVETLR